MTIVDHARRIAMISAPIGLIVFSLSHSTLSWSETQHLRDAGLEEWMVWQYLMLERAVLSLRPVGT